MLDAIGADSVEELFDVPDSVAFDGSFGIDAQTEQAARRQIGDRLAQNDDLVEFLGRGHYDHYVPAVVDRLATRSEFLSSYTQYQPEVAQGFLQALFEYQSLLVELTGLDVANCSAYDAATALGEAALLSSRVRETSGETILVPELLRAERASVLENYVQGAGLTIETFAAADGIVDVDALAERIDSAVTMVYAENPTLRGTIEESLSEIAALADDHDALFCLGSDPVALSLLECPADVGADVVVGDASVLGLGASYGMGLGLFVTRDAFLRQLPGRIVGASEDAAGRRAYTLTLQTREQHIRRERATSNICTNQAWLALRTAIHAAWLGADGLLEIAEQCVELPRTLTAQLADVSGISAPVHDRYHFREFVARTERPARELSKALEHEGFAVHAVDTHEIQICLSDANEHAVSELVEALAEVAQ